ncbi:MAG: enoyl-CoA hydratase, partial [Actinomycetota bacterium]|nr:enoyl-CoA hydratase [Actinomycetota bacterium]
LPTAIDDLTAQISQLAPQSLTAAKVSLATINGHATNTDVQNAIQKCYESNDYLEGITAFIEKRSPDFNGT